MGCNTSQERVASENNNLNTNDESIAESGFHDEYNNGDIIAKNDEIMEFDEEAELAATRIQAVFRGHKVRKGHYSSNNDVSIDDNYEVIPLKTINKKIKDNNNDDEKLEKNIKKEENYNKNDNDDDDSIQKELAEAAVKIQATFRGHLQRKLANKSENNINNYNKNDNDDDDDDSTQKELAEAAVKIQATFRGHLQRKLANKSENNINNNNNNLKEKQQQEIDVDEIRKQVAEELDIDLDDPELHKAAAKIQASFRGFKTRKEIIT